jgi:hypothetical protein
MKPNNKKPNRTFVLVFIPLLVLNFTNVKPPHIEMKSKGDYEIVVKSQ